MPAVDSQPNATTQLLTLPSRTRTSPPAPMASIDPSVPSVIQRSRANQNYLTVHGFTDLVTRTSFTSCIVQMTTSLHSLSAAFISGPAPVTRGLEKVVHTLNMVMACGIAALIVTMSLIYARPHHVFSLLQQATNPSCTNERDYAIRTIIYMHPIAKILKIVVCATGRFVCDSAIATMDLIADNTVMPVGDYLRDRYPAARLLMELVGYYLRPIIFPGLVRPSVEAIGSSIAAQTTPSGSAHEPNTPVSVDEIARQACARLQA